MPFARRSSVSQADFRLAHVRAGRCLVKHVCTPAQELLEPAACLERNHTSHLRFRVLFEDSDPAVPPIDLLVLDLEHLAATAARVEGSDDSVAHLVTSGQLDLRIPDVTADDRAAQRSRDLERCRDVPLLDARAGSCPDIVDIVPGQLRHAARGLVEELARLQ